MGSVCDPKGITNDAKCKCIPSATIVCIETKEKDIRTADMASLLGCKNYDNGSGGEMSVSAECSKTGDGVTVTTYEEKDCTGIIAKTDKAGKEEDNIVFMTSNWAAKSDKEEDKDKLERVMSTCYGGKTYASTTAAAAGKLAAESPAPGPSATEDQLGGATTTMMSAAFALLGAAATAVMLM